METISFKIGDIVQLKSGGPRMTVQRMIGAEQTNIGLKAGDEFLKMRGFRTIRRGINRIALQHFRVVHI